MSQPRTMNSDVACLIEVLRGLALSGVRTAHFEVLTRSPIDENAAETNVTTSSIEPASTATVKTCSSSIFVALCLLTLVRCVFQSVS